MSDINNKIKGSIETDPAGTKKLVDEDNNGIKAIPVTFVTKKSGTLTHLKQGTGVDPSSSLKNEMNVRLERDQDGNVFVVDVDVDGKKAIPISIVTKDENGKFIYFDPFSGSTQTVTWDDIQNKPTTFKPSAHTHNISDVTNLQTTLNGKANSVHTHSISDVTGLQTALDGKANTVHTHAISDITNLQNTLNSKLTANKAVAQADSVATDVAGLVADFNALLAKLRTAGIIAN